ncbi:hypothetical protein [Listeria booriae]|uniref:hypothetical protein n=1 Tax=Listeria booriae TaxID=1552123 RepID=UPI001623E99F|nr:hypothetical protein [Listeria booriae]MBC2036895.1 hypothetical protein [Listeria booriae]
MQEFNIPSPQNQPKIWTIIWVFLVYMGLSLIFQVVSILWMRWPGTISLACLSVGIANY